MKTNRIFAFRIGLAWLALAVLAPPGRADTFTATFTNEFGDGLWERDAHIGMIGDPGDPNVPGNWSTGAYPHNGHFITDPNTGNAVPGMSPLYDVVINIAAPCTVTMTPFIQSLNVSNPATLTIAPNGLLLFQGGGDLHNDGVIFVNNGGNNPTATLRFDANTNITGTGTIELRGFGTTFNTATFNINGATVTHGAGHFLHGYGSIIGFGSSTSTLINNGTISADDPNHANLQLILNENAPNQNNGLIRAILGGVLLYGRGSINQTGGGSFVADGTGSIIQLGGSGPQIIGGTLDTDNGGVIMATPAGGGAYLENVTNNGDLLIPHATNPLVVLGTGLTNNGTITISDGLSGSGFGTQLRIDSNSLLGGNGDVRLRGFGTTYGVANITISGGGITLTNGANHLIHGYGTIDGYFGTGTLINNGTISGNDLAGDLQLNLNPHTPNQNNGLIQASGGGVLLLSAGVVDQTGGGTLLATGNGSRLQIGGGEGVAISGGALNTANGGVIQSKYSVLRGSITNSGTFEMLSGNGASTLVEATTLTNNGTMTAAVDSTFRFDANNTAIGGTGAIVLPANTTMIINGSQNVTNGAGHTIKGNGTIFVVGGGSFTNNGIFSPGLSPGKITVNGNYTQGTSGALNIEIAGHTPITQYDQLAVTGNAALNGTLNISLINGFVPAVGDVFQIITTGSFSGSFATVNTTGFTAQVNYSATSITMTVLTVGGVTPTPTPSKLLNIATRMRVQTGENVLIGGFIVTGTAPKQVIIRAIGPSLSVFFPDALADPTLELFQGSTLLATNDNWRVPGQNESDVLATGIPPTDNLESALVRTLQPGAYTAIVRDSGGASGIGLVEAYDLTPGANSKLANISTRGFVETDNNVMIAGLIIGPPGGSNATVVVRAIGPSLSAFIPGALQDPTLELKDANGTTLISNDDWQQGQPAEIQQAGLAPTDTRESAVLATLAPGSYTAIVRGAGNTTGVGLVEVYHLQ